MLPEPGINKHFNVNEVQITTTVEALSAEDSVNWPATAEPGKISEVHSIISIQVGNITHI